MEPINVIRQAVDSNSRKQGLSSLYSATYFVTPLLIPTDATAMAIVAKLLNCPIKANPLGPRIIATTLMLTNPASILTNVDIAVNEKTLTMSTETIRFAIFFIPRSKFYLFACFRLWVTTYISKGLLSRCGMPREQEVV